MENHCRSLFDSLGGIRHGDGEQCLCALDDEAFGYLKRAVSDHLRFLVGNNYCESICRG